MTTLLQRRIGFVAGCLSVLLLATRPASAASTDKDLAEIKSQVLMVSNLVQALRGEVAGLDRKQDATSNALSAGLSALQSAPRPVANSDAASQRFAQVTASLQSLSDSVTKLTQTVNEMKQSDAKPDDSKAEIKSQLQGIGKQLDAVNSKLQVAGNPAVDPELRQNMAKLLANSSHPPGPQGPGWPEYALLGLGGASVVLLLAVLFTLGGKIASSQRTMIETRDALARFGVQMGERIKTMEGSNASIQAVGEKVTQVLGQAETAINGQLEAIAKKVNSSQLSELVEGTAMSKTEMSRLRAETATLQKAVAQVEQNARSFMDEIQKRSGLILADTKNTTKQLMDELEQTTRKWIADFEKQTNNSIGQVKAEAHSLDKLFWPEPFLDDGKLSPARERIRARANANDPAAFALMLGLGELQLCLTRRDGDHSRTVEALDKLGQLAYRFWKDEPDASVETTFDAAQTWGAEINRLLNANNVPLSLRIIMPRATFDMGTMLSESSLTGSTTRVHEPLSWTVIKQAGETHKVLVTGKVITE